MQNKNLFIVIEGLDGSGKTEISRRLTQILEHFPRYQSKVKLTFEPHDPSCSGVYIRQVLMKRISKFSPKTLALAFAANRLDHCDREINPFLDQGEGRIVICDRYYLSSLVYQSNNRISMNEIMSYNNQARKPDITLFLNVSNKVCYERMKKRATSKELFEKDLTQTRNKYFEAIEFLKSEREEKIIEINADEEIESVLGQVIEKLTLHLKDRISIHPFISLDFLPKYFSLEDSTNSKITDIAIKIAKEFTANSVKHQNLNNILNNIHELARKKVEEASINELGSMFLDHLTQEGFSIGERLAWSDLDAFELSYKIPMGINQHGIALFVDQAQRIDVVLKKAMQTERNMTDFMFVFDPSDSHLVNEYYDRELIYHSDKTYSLLPNTIFVTKVDIVKVLLSALLEVMFFMVPNLSEQDKQKIEEFVKQKQLESYVTYDRRKAQDADTLPF